MLSAATRRALATSATHRLAVESACPNPQPNTKVAPRHATLLLRFNPATPAAIRMNPHANACRYPRPINQRIDATPTIEPQNWAVKNSPARWSLNDQCAIKIGRIGPIRVVATPVTTNAACSTIDAADEIGSEADRVWVELIKGIPPSALPVANV